MPGNLDSTLTRTILNRADAGIWNLPLPEMPSGIPGCTFGRTSPVLRGAKRPTAQTPSKQQRAEVSSKLNEIVEILKGELKEKNKQISEFHSIIQAQNIMNCDLVFLIFHMLLA